MQKLLRFAMPLVILLTKSTKLLKALKFLKFTTFFLTFLTMSLSAFAYAFFLGPWFAIGFVILLFIHEMGHVAAMAMKGMPVRAPVFIPFLGAVIFSPPFKNQRDEAFVGYAGPLAGGLASLALFGIWAAFPSDLLLLLSYTSALLNLFNLIPIHPLDGGRVTQVVGEWFKYVGFGALFLLTLYTREPAFLLIWILVITDLRLEPNLKFGTGIACQASMILFMIAGFGDQPWYIDALDVCLASFFNVSNYRDVALMRNLRQLGYTENPTVRELLEKDGLIGSKPLTPESGSVRMLWLGAYVALALGLIVLMASQVPYLPTAVK